MRLTRTFLANRDVAIRVFSFARFNRRLSARHKVWATHHSDASRDYLLHGVNAGLVALVKCPLSDPFSSDEPGVRQNPQVLACSGLANAELPGNQ